MSDLRPARSALFMPANNPRAIAKARTLPCDIVILDLEDAVAPEAKAAARDGARAALAEGGFGSRRLVLRINALDTPWGHDDAAAGADFDAVLIPKLSGVQQLSEARGAVGSDGPPLYAMIETMAALLALPAIAAAAADHRLAALVAGTNDLAKEMRCAPGADRLPLLPALAQIVTAARAHGLLALDGVSNVLAETPGLVAECEQGARFGFDGKTLIHPAQIAAANRAFSPSADRVAWARAVVAAYRGQPEAGAIRVNGQMVERLHLIEAERIVALTGDL